MSICRRAAWTAAAMALAAACQACPGQTSAGDWDDLAVEHAVERGKAHLWSKCQGDRWPEHNDQHAQINPGGVSALCLYALLEAGEDARDERVGKCLEALAAVDMKGTYAVAFRANVWASLGAAGAKYRDKLQQDVQYLVRGLNSRGAYSYVPLTGMSAAELRDRRQEARYDNSNSQVAVLGVWAGARRGVEVAEEYWRKVEGHWAKEQQRDGGWGYGSGSPSYGSMSAAGLATMLICFDQLRSRQFVACEGVPKYPPIESAMSWMDRNFSPTANGRKGDSWYYYYLYCVERVGLASGYKHFGGKDWYKLSARRVLAEQRKDGGWGNLADTAFAMLFLARGRHPVLFNKLRYEGAWNARPRDLANLTRWISDTFERPVSWQIVDIDAAVEDWHDAPILYVSGAATPRFTNEEIDKLRTFVEQGGTILSEAACNRSAFTVGMIAAYRRMFPRYEMKRLDPDDGVYRLHFRIGRGRTLLGLSNGVRLLAVHTPRELSLAWQLNQHQTQAETFEQAANLYFYVTDKGPLRRRGVSQWPAARPFTPAAALNLAVVKHRGNCRPEPLAWKRFALLMGARHAVKVEVSEPTAPQDLDPKQWPVAAMTGTGKLALSDDERAGLRAYLAGGGMLIVDAAGGDEAFAESVAEQAALLVPDGKEGPITLAHPIFTSVGPPVERVAYRPAVGLTGPLASRPRLRGIVSGKRVAVVLSRDDLTAGLLGYPCWGLKGYEPESCFEIVRNLLLYGCGKSLPAAPAQPLP